jgi:hypothetical protein
MTDTDTDEIRRLSRLHGVTKSGILIEMLCDALDEARAELIEVSAEWDKMIQMYGGKTTRVWELEAELRDVRAKVEGARSVHNNHKRLGLAKDCVCLGCRMREALDD